MPSPVIEGWVSSDGGSTASTTLTIDTPSGIVVGEWLLMSAYNDSIGAGPEFADNVTDWNFIGSFGDGSSDAHIGLWWKVADGGEGTDVTVTSANAEEWGGHMLRISGADTTAPIDASGSNIDGGSGNPKDFTGITTTVVDTLVVYFIACDGSDTSPMTLSTLNGWAATDEIDDLGNTDETSGGVGRSFGSRDIATASATGDIEVTLGSGDGAVGVLIAIAPGEAVTDEYVPTLAQRIVRHSGRYV